MAPFAGDSPAAEGVFPVALLGYLVWCAARIPKNYGRTRRGEIGVGGSIWNVVCAAVGIGILYVLFREAAKVWVGSYSPSRCSSSLQEHGSGKREAGTDDVTPKTW